MNYETRERIYNAKETINVSSTAETSAGRMLSNFAATPFELDGKRYQTVESFWQALYFPEGSNERELIASLDGRSAKKAGIARPENLREIMYQEKPIEVG